LDRLLANRLIRHLFREQSGAYLVGHGSLFRRASQLIAELSVEEEQQKYDDWDGNADHPQD
jgi:hypothetical protein